jgi:hypothetical protein
MSNPVYVGKGKTVDGKYGQFQSVNIELDVLLNNCKTAKNGKKYVDLTISKKKETDQYGYDLKVVLNQQKEEETATNHMPDRDDLPF